MRGILRSGLNFWFILVGALSWLLVRILSVILFPTVVLAYSIGMRLVGFDPLNRGVDQDRPSYWTDAELTNEDLEEFKRQY